MCGLVGMAGFLEYKHKQAMKDLFFLNSLRGKDSTGISIVDRKRSVFTRKMTVPGYEFIEHPPVISSMSHADQLWIGHGRYKTMGEISKANAHPFEITDEKGLIYLVGAHNGTLENKWDIEREVGKFGTDSEALFHWLYKAEDYKTAIAKLKGAWALVWWNPLKDTVYFCRNKERPLVYAFTKDHKVIIWASEAWMLFNACKRNGVELDMDEKEIACHFFNTDTLYSIAIPQERDKKLPELVKEGGYVGAPATNFCNRAAQNLAGMGFWHPADTDDEEPETQTATGTKGSSTNTETDNVIEIGFPRVKGFNGQPISEKEFKKIRDKGCAWCKQPIEDNLIVAFINEDALCCVRCFRDTHPKGDCLHSEEDEPFEDDDLPLSLTQKGSEEYKSLIEAAARGVVG